MREIIFSCIDRTVETCEKGRRIETGRKKREEFMYMEVVDDNIERERKARIYLTNEKKRKFLAMDVDSEMENEGTYVDIEMEVFKDDKEEEHPVTEEKACRILKKRKRNGTLPEDNPEKIQQKNTPEGRTLKRTNNIGNWWEDTRDNEQKKKEAELRQMKEKQDKKIKTKEMKERRIEETRKGRLRMKNWTVEIQE